jgi:hypothetical protein
VTEEWFFAKDDEKFGPVSLERIRELAEEGTLQSSDLVWKEGMADWIPSSSVVELEPEPKPDPPPLPRIPPIVMPGATWNFTPAPRNAVRVVHIHCKACGYDGPVATTGPKPYLVGVLMRLGASGVMIGPLLLALTCFFPVVLIALPILLLVLFCMIPFKEGPPCPKCGQTGVGL